MSSTIEYRHLALKFDTASAFKAFQRIDPDHEASSFCFHEDTYLVFVESGSSNTVDANNRLARRWYLQAGGQAADVIEQACRWSVYIERETTRIAGHRRATAETYIRLYRKLVANAISGPSAFALLAGNTVSFRLPEERVRSTLWLTACANEGRLVQQSGKFYSNNEPPGWTLQFPKWFAERWELLAMAADAYTLGQLVHGEEHVWVTPDDAIARNLGQSLDEGRKARRGPLIPEGLALQSAGR